MNNNGKTESPSGSFKCNKKLLNLDDLAMLASKATDDELQAAAEVLYKEMQIRTADNGEYTCPKSAILS